MPEKILNGKQCFKRGITENSLDRVQFMTKQLGISVEEYAAGLLKLCEILAQSRPIKKAGETLLDQEGMTEIIHKDDGSIDLGVTKVPYRLQLFYACGYKYKPGDPNNKRIGSGKLRYTKKK